MLFFYLVIDWDNATNVQFTELEAVLLFPDKP